MKNDLIRAFCIALMVVPIVSFARIAGASTPIDFTAEEEFFAPPDSAAYMDSFRVEFFEQLFGYSWTALAATYRLHLVGPEEIDQAIPYAVLGTNGSDNPFLMTVRSILEVNLGQLSQDKQVVMSEAHVDRAWIVYGDFETDLGFISTVAILLQGSDDEGATWQRVIPGYFDKVFTDEIPLSADGPDGNIVAVFGDCPCPEGLCDSVDPELLPEAAIILATCAVAALVGGTVNCLSSRETCRDTANAESVFCANRCGFDDDCRQCCFDRWQIAIDACGPWWGCSADHPSPSDFSMCYDNNDNDQQ